jgi:hypothetical protein
VQQTGLRGGIVEYLSQTSVAQQSGTKIIYLIIINLVTPEAGAKLKLLFNQLASDVHRYGTFLVKINCQTKRIGNLGEFLKF